MDADEQTTETEAETPNPDGTTVEVVVTPPETVEPEAAEVVVVEAPETGNPATEAVLVEAAIDEAGKLALLEAAVVTLTEEVQRISLELEEVKLTAKFAMEEAVEATQVAEVATAPEPESEQAPPEQDSEPDREHAFFRPLFGGNK